VSHFSRIKTQMVDKTFLVQALRDLGYATEEGDLKIGGFAWSSTPVSIKVATPGYDIGFRLVDGKYSLVADWWGVKGISRTRFLRELTQRYAYLVTRTRLEEQGFTVSSEERGDDGRIHLVLRRAV
jgi:hypothetical protein